MSFLLILWSFFPPWYIPAMHFTACLEQTEARKKSSLRKIISPPDILIDEILAVLNTSLSEWVAWDEITFRFTNHDRNIESQHWKGPWVTWFISLSKERSSYTWDISDEYLCKVYFKTSSNRDSLFFPGGQFWCFIILLEIFPPVCPEPSVWQSA